jgi:Nuclease-related domain
MRTVEPTWRNLAKGHERVRELELSLQLRWAPQVEQAQRQKHQADLDAWNFRQEQRVKEHERALSIWTQAISDQRLRLRATRGAGVRRAGVCVPVSVLFLVSTALLGVVDINAVQLILLGIGIGLAIAFTPVTWSAIQFAQLQSKKPSVIAMEDPKPQEEEPIRLALIDQWWGQISDDGTHQSKATADYGDVGEEQFYRHLTRSLSDDHVGIRGVLVKQGLDVDLLVVGPTNVWVFEVKHWSGTITCRNGNWWRSKSYYAPGGVLKYEELEIKAFDRQWMRERREVEGTLRRRVHPAHLADWITGGLVFTHPSAVLDIDQSRECGYGPPEFWTTHLREVAAKYQGTITQQSKLRILDALLDRAERIDYRYTQRRCCIELADRLADDMTDWAKDYVACHTKLVTVGSPINTPGRRLVDGYGTADPETST